MGKQALTSHAKGKRHAALETAKKSTVPISLLLSPASSRSHSAAASNLAPDVIPASASCTQSVGNVDPLDTSVAAATECISKQPEQDSTVAVPTRGSTIQGYMQRDAVSKTEILFCLLAVARQKSCRDIGSLVELLPDMFPDSDIAAKVQLKKSKINYSIVFGLGPFFTTQLQTTVASCDIVALGFDESLNKVSQNQQMDIHVRYWDDKSNQVAARYLNSVFLGKSSAKDLVTAFVEGTSKANVNLKKQVVQISMDGPNVNKAFLREVKSKLKVDGDQDDPIILDFGTCGLHTVHGAFKTGCNSTGWNLVHFLRALYNLFKNVPSRRADFTKITNSTVSPQKFCAVRWVENKVVAVRAQQILSAVEEYVTTIERVRKEQQELKPKPKLTIGIPECNSFIVVRQCLRDKMLRAKLAFFESMAARVEPFLTKFQSDAPLAPFLYSSLRSLVRDLMSKFVKTDVMESQAFSQIDLANSSNLLGAEIVDIGYGTKKAIGKCQVSGKDILVFRNECRTFMKSMVAKILEKSPLVYSFTKGISCLDPEVAANGELAKRRLESALTHLTALNRIGGHEADAINSEFRNLMDMRSVRDMLKDFDGCRDHLDQFWMTVIGEKRGFDNLKKFIKLVCILFHGNASLERGFSANSSLLVENLTETSLVALRTVHDAIKVAGGVKSILITKQLIHSFRNAHARYNEAMMERRAADKAREESNKKRKEVQGKLQELQAKKAKLLEHTEREVADIEDEVQSLKKSCK